MNSSTVRQSQLDEVLRKLPQELLQAQFGPDEPRAVFRTALTLTREQEERVTLHCLDKIREIDARNGREHIQSPDWWSTLTGATADNQNERVIQTFYGSRAMWDMVYHMKMSWRPFVYGGLKNGKWDGGIWGQSNTHLPLTNRFLRQMVARGQQFFFGSMPWYQLCPVGAEDMGLASLMNRWTRGAFDKAKSISIINKAIEFAFIRGEGIIKRSWRHERTYYRSFQSVAVDPEGQPLRAVDGDYIYESDRWITREDGAEVLKRSPETGLPEGVMDSTELTFQRLLVDKAKTIYRGLDLTLPHYLDFIIDPAAKSVDEADFVAHRYRRTAIDIFGDYVEHLRNTGNAEAIPRVVDLLKDRTPTGRDALAGGPALQEARPELGETSFNGSSTIASGWGASGINNEPDVQIAECYLLYDALGEGQPRQIVVTIDVDRQRIIFADYLANYTPDGKRPFSVLRVQPVDNRWHGVSMAEPMWALNHAIDLNLNRFSVANSRSGQVVFWSPENVYESDDLDDPTTLELNGGRTYTLKTGKRAEDTLQVVPIIDYTKNDLMQLIELLMQVQAAFGGVASSQDAGLSGLPQAETATGIRQMERNGNEQFGYFLAPLQDGVEDVIKGSIALMQTNADEEEVVRWEERDIVNIQKLLQSQVADFDYDLKLKLSRFAPEVAAAQNNQVIAILKDYAAQFPPLRQAIRPLVESQCDLFDQPSGPAGMDVIDEMMPQPIPVMGATPSGGPTSIDTGVPPKV
jgi:hypothetical protein